MFGVNIKCFSHIVGLVLNIEGEFVKFIEGFSRSDPSISNFDKFVKFCQICQVFTNFDRFQDLQNLAKFVVF